MLIDVRTQDEYNLEHHDGAINIPVNEIDSHPIAAQPGDEIILHCQSGARARFAQDILKKRGFTNVSLLNGTGAY